MDRNSADPGNTKWNNHQEKHAGGLNEGFSSENLPPDFDPGSQDARPEHETEIDADGERQRVQRARFPEKNDLQQQDGGAFESNRAIEHPKSTQNRDYNYDRDAQRYPPGHPENHENRGNPNP